MPTTPAATVLSIGETLIDLIASDGATRLEDVASFAARPGGAPANVVVALARLGVPSAFCGVVGDDPFGGRLRTTLRSAGVDVSRLRSTGDADTTVAFAWKDARGDGHFRLLRMADRLISDADVDAAGVESMSALVVGSVALAADPSRAAVTRAVALAAAAGVPVCFDINVRPTLWPDRDAAFAACLPVLKAATLLKLSLDDARYLFDPEMEAVGALLHAQGFGARFTVLTDGARGAWWTVRDDPPPADRRFIPAFAVDAVDPTGAGDAFTAALISRLIAAGWRGLGRDDVEFASAAGALTTTRRGAMEALPDLADIRAFLDAQRSR